MAAIATTVAFGADTRAGRTADSKKALAMFKEADGSLAATLAKASGYAIFPTVGKGAIGVGGAHGSGQLFEKGAPVGETTLTQLSIGLQLGGQAYSELIIFENADVLEDFKRGNFEFSAQASAVAAASGASANAKFEHGVMVITLAKKGLMYEASVGGQKFGFKAY
jgi:lipid-binding SYLF domain-containing protein